MIRVHYLILALIVLLGMMAVPTMAQSPTEPSEVIEKEVDQLKEKVAKQVKGLNVKSKAVAGVVQDIVGDTIFIINASGERIEALVDKTLTNYYEVNGSRLNDINSDDFEVDEYVFITGPEIGETITANAVYKDTPYRVFSGKIVEVDKEEFTLRIAAIDKSTYLLDIETSTTTLLMDINTLETSKIGFSKFKEGDAVHAVIELDPTAPIKTQYTAVKLLVIPNEYFIQ
ncbi:MAG: hypothetical protein O3B87_01315 [bacterium]|nr:hypothetical protein [bacterium]